MKLWVTFHSYGVSDQRAKGPLLPPLAVLEDRTHVEHGFVLFNFYLTFHFGRAGSLLQQAGALVAGCGLSRLWRVGS